MLDSLVKIFVDTMWRISGALLLVLIVAVVALYIQDRRK